jgi:nucleotide-binding universal stress UspA family protein
MKYKKILVCTDLSEPGNLALYEALEHLKPGGLIRLLHVAELAYSVLPGYAGSESAVMVFDPELTRKSVARKRVELERLKARLKARIHVELLQGERPVPLIAKVAAHFKPGLLVLSTHGRSGLSRIFLGSVAQKLLGAYPGQVLLLRPRRHKK